MAFTQLLNNPHVSFLYEHFWKFFLAVSVRTVSQVQDMGVPLEQSPHIVIGTSGALKNLVCVFAVACGVSCCVALFPRGCVGVLFGTERRKVHT